MKSKYSSTLNPWSVAMTPQDFAKWRSALAKRANVRLASLEKAKSKVTGESLTFGAYRRYAADVLDMEKPRFSESKKAGNVNEMRAEINKIQQFLNAKTSTISGAREVERARIKTFQSGEWGRKRYDDDGNLKKRLEIKSASNADFYDFLNSGILSSKLTDYFTSEQIIEMYELAMREGKSTDEILDIMFTAYDEYRTKQASASLEDISKRLGLQWLD